MDLKEFGDVVQDFLNSATHVELEEFGDVVQDGEEDDRENVGPCRPGVGKLQKDVVYFYNWLFPKMYKIIDLSNCATVLPLRRDMDIG